MSAVSRPRRPSGILPSNLKAAALKPPPGTAPGARALTRMPAGPRARASPSPPWSARPWRRRSAGCCAGLGVASDEQHASLMLPAHAPPELAGDEEA
jgi:hypothetical protein